MKTLPIRSKIDAQERPGQPDRASQSAQERPGQPNRASQGIHSSQIEPLDARRSQPGCAKSLGHVAQAHASPSSTSLVEQFRYGCFIKKIWIHGSKDLLLELLLELLLKLLVVVVLLYVFIT